MIPPLLCLFALSPGLQDPAPAPWLTPGAEVAAELVGPLREYRFLVEGDGPVYFDLRAYLFDARLELRDSAGMLLAQADDGPYGQHARLVLDPALGGVEYRLRVVDQPRLIRQVQQPPREGPFQLRMELGIPPVLERAALSELALADARAKLEAVTAALGARSVPATEAMIELDWLRYRAREIAIGDMRLAEVVAVREELLGPDDFHTLSALDWLAYACDVQGRYAEAAAIFQRTLEARRRDVGSEDVDTVYSQFNLA